MTGFDDLLADYTKKEDPKVHGAIIKCVDKNGKELFSRISGYDSLSPDASPLREDAVLKVASATKLITSIALLQCVDNGLLSLDEPLANTVLPEFKGKDILTAVSGTSFTFQNSQTPITARHLLTHTSGLGYRFTHVLLRQRAEARKHENPSFRVTERYEMPLVFEPGTGWLYGCSLDWAGVVVSRLSGLSLEDYMVENIWKRLGLTAPFPRFNIARHPDYNARAMGGALRKPDGKLEPSDTWAFDNHEDQEGGSGLSATTKDYVAVLTDLISDSPKLLKPDTISEMFTPQLAPKSPSVANLLALRAAWDTCAGPITENHVNHGLGGLLCVGPVPEINQPENMLTWGGASNIIWWVHREKRVAGFFATQQAPFGNPAVTELVNAWKKEFWTQFN